MGRNQAIALASDEEREVARSAGCVGSVENRVLWRELEANLANEG
jgi:hypothetical protein